ncbi:aldehyde dehydrogenase family protein [Amycolatopsis keratiniphila]|uniref:aldehyde dehydrogenase family protein n=1 Tax=Amycolatopsis keratiniphila TaxID=129921 RepID=UPI00087C3E87|nr:aldehyde dehydrogenase family protein [Amycolatopsis keratiniphila]OLZ58714.1 aldehyde dehydrogenase [Amycolatopsis keratiniphila subsp. nogabecina]SDU69333.1 Acyl-CoA reductase [Amycolatopsis keratiniphila]
MTTTVRAERLEVRSPQTGDLAGTHPMHTAADVDAVVARARAAAGWWAGLTFRQRAERLDRFRGVIARRLQQLAGIVHEETGKPHADAALEAALVLDHIAWAAKNAPKVLGKRRAGVGLLTANQAASVEYRPLGVVGVIGPWNYPVFTPLGSIVYALAAGNAVVFKPSEFTPGTGAWLVGAFAEIVPEHPVLQLVTGDGSTGAALCESEVDKIAFTGSTETAKKVMAACARRLTPIVAECGGKDPLLVDSDADLDAAADAAVWGGMANAGQSCIGTERVYVHADVYDAFLHKLVDVAARQRAGTDPDATIGPITMPEQVEVIRRHIADALARGGTAVLGGTDAIEGRLVQPTILTGVPEDSTAMTEETFGPTLTVTKVRDMDEAVERANATGYGLGAAVFAKKHGEEIGDRLRCGMVAVNAVFNYPQIPSLPFGGVGDSGFGRIHGPDGLREFTYARSVARQRFTPPLALTTFGRTAKTDALVAKIMTLLHGKH